MIGEVVLVGDLGDVVSDYTFYLANKTSAVLTTVHTSYFRTTTSYYRTSKLLPF